MWDEDRGFGFIVPDNGPDIFVHAKSIVGASVLIPGSRVDYEAVFVLRASDIEARGQCESSRRIWTRCDRSGADFTSSGVTGRSCWYWLIGIRWATSRTCEDCDPHWLKVEKKIKNSARS